MQIHLCGGMDAAIVIFARHPTPGRVKTRLAKGTGDEAAAHFYRACAEHVIGEALRCLPSALTGMSNPHVQLPSVRRWADPALACLRSCPGCTCYLYFSAADEEAHVRAWLAPLGQVRPALQRAGWPCQCPMPCAGLASARCPVLAALHAGTLASPPRPMPFPGKVLVRPAPVLAWNASARPGLPTRPPARPPAC